MVDLRDLLKEAADPTTPSERLDDLVLGDDVDEQVLRLASRNPNLDGETLRWLMSDGYPDAWANPQAPFALIIQPASQEELWTFLGNRSVAPDPVLNSALRETALPYARDLWNNETDLKEILFFFVYGPHGGVDERATNPDFSHPSWCWATRVIDAIVRMFAAEDEKAMAVMAGLRADPMDVRLLAKTIDDDPVQLPRDSLSHLGFDCLVYLNELSYEHADILCNAIQRTIGADERDRFYVERTKGKKMSKNKRQKIHYEAEKVGLKAGAAGMGEVLALVRREVPWAEVERVLFGP